MQFMVFAQWSSGMSGIFLFFLQSQKAAFGSESQVASLRLSHCALGWGELSWCGEMGSLWSTEHSCCACLELDMLIKDVENYSAAKSAFIDMKAVPGLTKLLSSMLQACPTCIPAPLGIKEKLVSAIKSVTLWWALILPSHSAWRCHWVFVHTVIAVKLSTGFLSSNFLQRFPDLLMMWRWSLLCPGLNNTSLESRWSLDFLFLNLLLCCKPREHFHVCVPAVILNKTCMHPPKPAFGCSSSNLLCILQNFCKFTQSLG